MCLKKIKIYITHLFLESITTPPSCHQRIKAVFPVGTIKIDNFRTIPVVHVPAKRGIKQNILRTRYYYQRVARVFQSCFNERESRCKLNDPGRKWNLMSFLQFFVCNHADLSGLIDDRNSRMRRNGHSRIRFVWQKSRQNGKPAFLKIKNNKKIFLMQRFR